MQIKKAMVRKNTLITEEQEIFIKRYSKEKNISEGDVFRLALDKLKKHE